MYYTIEYSPKLAVFSYVFYIVMLLIASPMKNYQNNSFRVGTRGIVVFFIMYAILNVFSLWEYDTYHTWNHFVENGFDNLFGYENVYQRIALITGDHYFIWRCFIWIPACYFIYKSADILGLVNSKLLLSIVLFGSFVGYTRGMIGFTMLVLGSILFVSPNKSINKLIGLIIIVISYYFHKSMFIMILFSVLAYIPLQKRHIKFLLLIFPILTLLMPQITPMLSSLELSEGVGEVGVGIVESTLESEKLQRNTNGKIIKLIELIPQYITLYYLGMQVFKYKVFEQCKYRKVFEYLFRFTFIGFYIASLFFFTDHTSWLFERFKHMAFFPMIISLTATFTYEKKMCGWMKYIVLYQILFIIFSHCLRVYSNL